jgi:hypothetical protein
MHQHHIWQASKRGLDGYEREQKKNHQTKNLKSATKKYRTSAPSAEPIGIEYSIASDPGDQYFRWSQYEVRPGELVPGGAGTMLIW